MASVKIIHYTHKKYSDGTSPLIIQVIKNSVTRKKAFAKIFDSQYDADLRRVIPRKHPNAATINQRISEEFNRIEQIILSGKDFDIEKIFDAEVNEKAKTFWDITEAWLQYIKSKNYGTFVSFESQICKFKEFVKMPDLLMSDIDGSLLDRYQAYLIRKGNKQSSINSAFKKIRMAAKYGHKIMGLSKNEAIADYFVKCGKKPNKTKLTGDELALINSLPYTGKMKEIVDMFTLAVYLRGMRIADVIQIRNEYITGQRLVYTSNKNKSHFNIKLVRDAIEIIDQYKSDREYLFSFFKFVWNDTLTDEENERAKFFHIKSVTANINGKLDRIAEKAGINKKISSHIAKHTFGKMAIDAIKDTNLRMDLMGHSSIEAHETYVRELSKEDELDNAADQIFKR